MSSGQPPAAIAVIRISGPAAIAAATALAGSLPPPRYAALRALRDRDGEILDRALVLVFPGPDSATGEDLVELHCHGGRAVVEAVERALHREPGIRRAEPGEFTRRALVHGRIDLNEAEGLADLLAAETELQRRHALMAAEGRVSGMVRGWLDRLAGLSARVEASIDYAEEGDLAAEADLLAGVVADQQSLAADMDAVLAVPPVERWRDGIRIVVAGPPNAGKSTLVNALAGRDAAIVSPIAGTTRDRIEVVVQRDGVGYVLIDTAGLREMTDDPIEQIGIERARDAVASAQVMLWLSDDNPPDGGSLVMRVHAKADLPGRAGPIPGSVPVSAWQPSTVESLWEEIAERSATLIPSGGGMALHRRAHDACVECREAIGEAPVDVVLHAERLRRGHRAVARALGVDATASMLDALFTRFCVGK